MSRTMTLLAALFMTANRFERQIMALSFRHGSKEVLHPIGCGIAGDLGQLPATLHRCPSPRR